MADSLTPAPAIDPPPFSMGLPVQPHFDLIEILPERAAERLRQLRLRSSEAHKVLPLFEDMREANTARFDAERALKRLTDHRSLGGYERPETDGLVIAAKRTLDRATADARRLSELSEVRSAAWQATSRVVSAVEVWLRDGRPPGTELQDYEGEVAKLNKNENLLDGIERHRRRCRELKADLARIAAAPFPSSHARARMREAVEALSMRGAVNVSRLIEHDGDIEFAHHDMRVPIIAGNKETPITAIAGWTQPDALALVCWLHKDALIARLDVEIDSEADDKSALSHAERQRQEAEVMRDLLAVERDESFFVWKAQAERLPVEHRADVNPLALLSLQLVTAEPVNGRPGTSWQHAIDIIRSR